MNDAMNDEDAKLVVLARAARARAYGEPAEGAAVRDADGRTYMGATFAHARPELAVSALRSAVSAAVSSGARAFEAAVVAGELRDDDLATLAEFGAGVQVYAVGPDGALVGEAAT